MHAWAGVLFVVHMTRSSLASRSAAFASIALGVAWGCSSPGRDFDPASADDGGDAGETSSGKGGKGGAPTSPCADSAGACSDDGGASGGDGSAPDAGAAGTDSSGAGTSGAAAGGATSGGAGGAPACVSGTEGCACKGGDACNGDLICRGTKCAKVVCGDKRIEGSEVCDDGSNFGTAVGDCAPDCSVLVTQKKILQSAAGVPTTFARNGANFIPSVADSYCPTGYKALFSGGGFRVASVKPNVGDGQVDWVLKPWTRYVNVNSQLIWLTQTVRLLGVTGGVFKGLTNAIVPGSNSGYLTGMSSNWVALPAGRNCDAWTKATSASQGMFGIGGSTTGLFLEQASDFTYPCSDTTSLRVYCVEQ